MDLKEVVFLLKEAAASAKQTNEMQERALEILGQLLQDATPSKRSRHAGPTGYNLFVKEQSATLKESAESWGKLTEDEKQVYRDRAQAAKSNGEADAEAGASPSKPKRQRKRKQAGAAPALAVDTAAQPSSGDDGLHTPTEEQAPAAEIAPVVPAAKAAAPEIPTPAATPAPIAAEAADELYPPVAGAEGSADAAAAKPKRHRKSKKAKLAAAALEASEVVATPAEA